MEEVLHQCHCKHIGCHINNCRRWCHCMNKEIPYDKCNEDCAEYVYGEPIQHKEETPEIMENNPCRYCNN